jgi:small-conductance mechanosensitive channel
MFLWKYMAIIFVFGAVGGVVNALLSDNGFILPRKEEQNNTRIIRPGFLVNIFIGGIAALVSWGLYGPFAEVFIIGGTTDPKAVSTALSLSSVIGALLVGVGGARWLTNEVDKKLLRAAASKAASGRPSDQKAIRISAAPPAEALNIAAE